MTIFDSAFGGVGNKVGFGHILTGMGSELEKLMHMARPRKHKQSSSKQPFVGGLSLCPVSPTVIGNHSASPVTQTQLRETEDDRWLQVEGGSPVRWHSCKGCAFLCAEHEPKCDVCGTRNPEHDEKVSSDGEAAQTVASCERYSKQSQTLSVLVIPDGPPLREDSEAEEASSIERPGSLVEGKSDWGDSGSNDDGSDDGYDFTSSDEDVDEGEGDDESLPGTLEVAPVVGTQVEVLLEDDRWHVAEVLATKGTKAKLWFASGEQQTVDVAVHAVRLLSYVNEDDDDEEENSAAGLEEGCESDEEQIPGTLDEAPRIGTLVEVLHDDEQWHPARITASNGTKATITDSDGEEDELDFEVHAVRLRDYVDKDGKIIDVVAEKAEVGATAQVALEQMHLGDEVE